MLKDFPANAPVYRHAVITQSWLALRMYAAVLLPAAKPPLLSPRVFRT